MEGLLERAGSKFSLVALASMRARQINSYYGQLGDGTQLTHPLPVAIGAGKTWKRVAVGRTHTCGIGSEGGGADSLFCWGQDANGEQGNGAGTTPQITPAPVNATPNNASPWTELAAGLNHSCALRADKTRARDIDTAAATVTRLGGAFGLGLKLEPRQGVFAAGLSKSLLVLSPADASQVSKLWGAIMPASEVREDKPLGGSRKEDKPLAR